MLLTTISTNTKDKDGARRRNSTAQQVEAIKIGMPLVERYGSTVEKDVLGKLEAAIKALKEAAAKVRALGGREAVVDDLVDHD